MIAPAEMALDYARWRRFYGNAMARDLIANRARECRQNAALLRSFNYQNTVAKRLDAQADEWEALL